MRFAVTLGIGLSLMGCASRGLEPPARVDAPPADSKAIVIGRSFDMDSAELRERRRVTVYLPPDYAETRQGYPVLYLLDGGAEEDFHHITGIVQVSVMNQIMEPVIVVGIENTERRRDMTGPTENPKDKAIAPHVGGSEGFRAFLRKELVPRVERDYRCNGQRAILGESLAGLFIVEQFLSDPGLFGVHIAVSPSLWWNDGFLLKQAEGRLKTLPMQGKTLYLTVGGRDDNTKEADALAELLRKHAPPGLAWHYAPLPEEAHNTVYHLGATRALRLLYPLKKEAPGGG